MDVASNVGYGCPHDVTQYEVEEACKMANAHEFITALPQVRLGAGWWAEGARRRARPGGRAAGLGVRG
jgi:ABC-type multidrug transport system fused ATPase/permease subunit